MARRNRLSNAGNALITAHSTPRFRAGWLLTGALVAGLLGAGMPEVAQAGNLEKLDSSLKLVPDDAAFYVAGLCGGEQIKAIGQSRAWVRLKAMPVVQMALGLYQIQLAMADSIPARIQAALDNPEGQKTLDLLGEMFSDEVFCCGDRGIIDLAELNRKVTGAGNIAKSIQQQAKGQANDPEAAAKLLTSGLVDHLDVLKVPGFLFGFKVKDTAKATERLARLESLVNALIAERPLLNGHFQRTKIDGHEYLTLTLDGSMLPWDEVQKTLKEAEDKNSDITKVVEHVKKQKLVIALGLRENYVLLSIGNSTKLLAQLGKGKTLIGRPEFRPLEKFADKRLTGISYLSKSLVDAFSTTKADIDEFHKQLEPLVDLAPATAVQKARIRKDITELAKDAKTLIPTPGAAMGFEFLTDHGSEGYSYSWAEQPGVDGSKPLGLLAHLGGNPLAACVGRGKCSVEQYDMLVKWVKVGYGYIEEFAVPQMKGDDLKKFNKFMTGVRPLLNRANDATRTMLLPALADGQVGFVLDAKLQSKHFLEQTPATEKAMPMIEPALVMGVSDAALLRKAKHEYHEVIDGILKCIHEIDPDNAPLLKIPVHGTAKTAHSEIYTFTLPKEWGVDKQVAPGGAIADKVAVLTISPKHTERLLTATPLVAGSALANPSRPRAMAFWLDWAGLVDAATPWINLGVEQILKEQFHTDQPDANLDQAESIRAQVRTALDLLKVFRNVSGESYFENGALVTHLVTEIRDVK